MKSLLKASMNCLDRMTLNRMWFSVVSILLFIGVAVFGDPVLSPNENELRYRRGGLCLNFDCTVSEDQAFTFYYDGGNEEKLREISVTRYSDSVLVYLYSRNYVWSLRSAANFDMDALLMTLEGKTYKPTTEQLRRRTEVERYVNLDPICEALSTLDPPLFYKPSQNCNPSRYCNVSDRIEGLVDSFVTIGYDTGVFRKNKNDLIKLIESMSSESLGELWRCEDPGCTRSCCPYYAINEKMVIDSCMVFDSEGIYEGDSLVFYRKERCDKEPDYLPYWNCYKWLECAHENGFNIVYHKGPFPTDDCDLKNWRGIKLDQATKKQVDSLKAYLEL